MTNKTILTLFLLVTALISESFSADMPVEIDFSSEIFKISIRSKTIVEKIFAEPTNNKSSIQLIDCIHVPYTMDLCDNNDVEFFACFISQFPNLKILSLCNGKLTDYGAEKIAEFLNGTVTTLYMAYNQIDSYGAGKIAEALTENTVLTTLTLTGNPIGEHGYQELAKALTKNTTLTHLHLDSGTGFSYQNAKSFAKALTKNTTLTTLGLSDCRINCGQAQEIAKSLTKNKALTSLDLSRNYIEGKGMESFAEALTKNKFLKTLSLGSHPTPRSAKSFVKTLTKNTTLIELSLNASGKHVSSWSADDLKIIEKIEELLNRNRKLVELTIQ